MAESPQLYLGIESGSSQPDTGLRGVINFLRDQASSQYRVGNEFERLIKRYLRADPLYKERFSDVWHFKEWTANRTEFDAVDTGIDLVAQETSGEYCAIQCKCFSENTRVTKRHIESFISASDNKWFARRMLVHTGGELGPNVLRTIKPMGSNFQVIGYGQLASRPIDWPDLKQQDPELLEYRHEPFILRQHQQEAFDEVVKGFRESDRGKLIMACGTGKTFAALRIAEEIAGIGGRVLYLVPSIGLFSQAMREWAEQQGVPHRYIGICSDTSAGKKAEDVPIQELEIPVTTDPSRISQALQETDDESMTVVYCTYHSLPIVESAQDGGALAFDIVLCDEAHRTTGVDSPDDKTSPFVLVHNADRIRAKKRLYMTATPRLYTEGAKAKAARHDIEVFSMDDPGIYGPEFHCLPFSRAVERDLLSDYKVVILTMYEPEADAALQGYNKQGLGEINITDATKFVGSWRALHNPEGKPSGGGTVKPLKRAIAFNNTIRNSKRLDHHWNDVINSAVALMPEGKRPVNFKCETQHVDGQHNAFDRKSRIEWLKEDSEGVCRILSNARCLSEGIDVPALDAVLFMTPRNSHVDIVQAVGRVMRKAPGKKYGYIILPVAIPPGTDPADALDNNERFAAVWSVLRALRSHDDRLDAEINKIDLNNNTGETIIFEPGEDGKDDEQQEIPFGPVQIPAQAIFAKIVEKCGDRRYWESWAKDVADIFARVVVRINNLLSNPDNDVLREWFASFHKELKTSINDSITEDNAVDMMAQHLLTRPVFNALFENYDFASGNPVANALDNLKDDFGEFGLDEETRDLEGFYESVRMRARGIDNAQGRQKVLLELYEKFFTTATKKDADRLGIVYTPVAVVDFILHSADEVLRKEFGRSLTDEGVHIIDPFTGVGTFLVRLLQSDLIRDEDLERKFRHELHANEIVLLAYYMAAVNIEQAYHGRRGEDSSYVPFDGIVLTDTFNLNEWQPTLARAWMPDNNARAERQQRLPIQVIVGNPPWSAGQRSASDDNPNVDYPVLEQRVKETYAEYSTATNKRHLYDTYKMAIRWASDRIKEHGQERGIVAFVTNGSWIDGNVDSGVRACLAQEFSSIYVFHLRGNIHIQMSGGNRAEGDNVFGQKSKTPVAITMLVKNPPVKHDGCRICYKDIGDYLNRDEKLRALREARSISGFNDWHTIKPDKHHDWIGQRSEAFTQFYRMGKRNAKVGVNDDSIFRLYSLGIATGRDPYIYNFSHNACVKNGRKMVENYLAAISDLALNPDLATSEAVQRHSSNLKWNRELEKNLKRQKKPNLPKPSFEKLYTDHSLRQIYTPTTPSFR